MSQATLQPAVSRIGPRQIVIIVLAVATGLVHLYRGLMMTVLAPPRTGRFAGGGRPPGGFAGGRPAGGGPSIMAMLPLPLSTLFFLNFAGYIILAIALYLPALARYQSVIRWILIVYAAVTIIMWFLITGGSPNLLAYIDKPVEVALIVLLFIDDRMAASASRG